MVYIDVIYDDSVKWWKAWYWMFDIVLDDEDFGYISKN